MNFKKKIQKTLFHTKNFVCYSRKISTRVVKHYAQDFSATILPLFGGMFPLEYTSRRGWTFVARNVGFARFGTHVSTKVIREYQPHFLGETYPRPGTFKCACGTNMGGKSGSHVLPRNSREYQLDKKSGTHVFPWYHACTN